MEFVDWGLDLDFWGLGLNNLVLVSYNPLYRSDKTT